MVSEFSASIFPENPWDFPGHRRLAVWHPFLRGLSRCPLPRRDASPRGGTDVRVNTAAAERCLLLGAGKGERKDLHGPIGSLHIFTNMYWLVVWNMFFPFFPHILGLMIPSD